MLVSLIDFLVIDQNSNLIFKGFNHSRLQISLQTVFSLFSFDSNILDFKDQVWIVTVSFFVELFFLETLSKNRMDGTKSWKTMFFLKLFENNLLNTPSSKTIDLDDYLFYLKFR